MLRKRCLHRRRVIIPAPERNPRQGLSLQTLADLLSRQLTWRDRGGRQRLSLLEVESGRTSLSWREASKAPSVTVTSHTRRDKLPSSLAQKGQSTQLDPPKPTALMAPRERGGWTRRLSVPSLQPRVSRPDCHAYSQELQDGCRVSCTHLCFRRQSRTFSLSGAEPKLKTTSFTRTHLIRRHKKTSTTLRRQDAPPRPHLPAAGTPEPCRRSSGPASPPIARLCTASTCPARTDRPVRVV